MSEFNVRWDDVKESYEADRLAVAEGVNFIEVYDNALESESCKALIEYFEKFDERGLCRQGGTSTHVDTSLKDSTDLLIDAEFMTNPDNAEFQAALAPVVQSLSKYCVRYLTKYHCLLPAAMPGPDGKFALHGEIMSDPALATKAMKSSLTVQSLQIQRYKPPGQGYHAWHYEQSNLATLDRVLFPVLYLNDVDEGGETEFFYWDVAVKPKAGRLVIAPGGFTHTHRMKPGILSGSKYILTTWYVKHG